jgi:hypothetical protein
MDTSIPKEIIASHFNQYYPSLSQFPQNYLRLFFRDVNIIEQHLAYLCPICLCEGIIFAPSLGLGMSSEFSLDHFPPESVGGFLKILVCKKCNNDAGGLFEKSLKEKMENFSFNNGIISAQQMAKAEILDHSGNKIIPGRYTTKITISEDKMTEISLKPKSKDKIPLLDKWIEDSKTNLNYKIELTVPLADENKVSKSFLKAAYLFCFHSWGYEFAYSTTGENMRKVLKGEAEYPCKTPTLWLRDSIELNRIQYTPLGLCYLQRPLECRCFMVNMMLEDKGTGYKNIASILIPNPTPTGWEELKQVQAIFDTQPGLMDISMAHVTDFTVRDRVLDGYNKSWEKLVNDNS